MSDDYPLNSIVPIYAIFRNQAKQPITTADGKIVIQDPDTGLYWNGAAFAAAPTLLQMVKVGDGDANSPGKWEYLFDTDTLSGANYLVEISDGNALAYNVPQNGEVNVGTGIVNLIELAAAGGVSRTAYNSTTSVLTVYRYDDPAVIVATFDMKDSSGSPAGNNPFFDKVPV